MKTFIEIKLFQVNKDKVEEFENYIKGIEIEQIKQLGCVSIKYMKRFYTIDGTELGDCPRELTKIVKCVKYFSVWEFDNKESYGLANKYFFDTYYKTISKMLIAPFDINLGYSIKDKE